MRTLLLLTLFGVASQVSMAQSVTDSLILYLPFDGNANDASGHGNNGNVHNVTPTVDRHGIANAAYDFNGTDSYIEIPASSSLSQIYTANEVTIAAWINIRQWYNNWNVFAVFEQYDSNTDWGSVLLEANWSSGGILFESGYNTNYIGCDYTWNFNEWHHLAVTYSRVTDTARFYVDGNLLCAKQYQQSFSSDSIHPYVIGRSLSGPDEYSDGMIDEVRIYCRVLRDSELVALPMTTTPTSIVEVSPQALNTYPNPISDILYVKTDKPIQDGAISIYDVPGKEVYAASYQAGDRLELDLRSLTSGMYFLRIQDGSQSYIQKFLKK